MTIPISLLLLALLFSSGLSMTDFFEGYFFITKYILVISLIYVLFVYKKGKIKINLKIFYLLTLLFLINSISSLINNNINSLSGSIDLYITYISLLTISSNLNSPDSLKYIFTIYLISQLPFIIQILFYLNSYPLQGIFYNPNSFGVVCATVLGALVSYLLATLEDFMVYNKKLISKNLFLLITLISILYLLVIGSQSRTAFITSSIVIFISTFYLLFVGIKSGKKLSILKTIFMLIFICIIIFVIIKFTPFNNYFQTTILDKFEEKVYRGDILSKRGKIWAITFKEAQLFGNGWDFFKKNVGITAHNTFVDILGKFGWISFIVFITFILTILYNSIEFAKTDTTNFRFFPLSMAIIFILFSMTETVTKQPVLVTLLCVGGIIMGNRKQVMSRI